MLNKYHIDIHLILGLILTLMLSLFVLYSASGQHVDMLYRQVIRTALAFVAMVGVAQLKPKFILKLTPILYIIGLILIILVEIVGDVSKGAQRWLDLGFLRVQPSELFKIAMPLTICAFLCREPLPPKNSSILISLVLVGIPCIIIAMQPDLGTAILVGVSGFIAIFLAGINLWWIVAAIAIVCIASPFIWIFLLHGYQKFRVITLFNPELDPSGAGYHIIQSKIAIGSGGLFGKGWLQGSQSQLDFLPEPHTDFIFAVLAEETGLIGFIVLFTVYAYIIGRCLYIAINIKDNFQRILITTYTFVFAFYIFVNTGMVSGILPVVGVPLPMISYGGTSLITLSICFGIIMSFYTHKKSLTFR